jgi:hypothetical protein
VIGGGSFSQLFPALKRWAISRRSFVFNHKPGWIKMSERFSQFVELARWPVQFQPEQIPDFHRLR